MRSLYPALALICLVAPLCHAGTTEDYDEVVATIRCDCSCHPQSVEACACGRAAEMRGEIAAMVEGTKEQPPMDAAGVIAQYVAQQGEQIRIAPAATGFNLLAWLGPLVALVLGLLSVALLLRRLVRPADPQAAAATQPALAADDPYRAKLQQQLEEWD